MKHILLALLLCSLLPAYAQNNDYFLMPYREGNTWGLCDTLGKVQVKPQYDGFTDLIVDNSSSQSYYFVRHNGRSIVVDHNNVQQLKEYDSVSPTLKVAYKNGEAMPLTYNYGNKYENTTGSFAVNTALASKPTAKPDNIPDIALAPSGKDGWALQINAYEKERLSLEKSRLESVNKEASKEDLAMIKPITFTPITHYMYYHENGKTGITQFVHKLQEGKEILVKSIMIPAEYDVIEEIDNYRVIIANNGKYGIRNMFNTKSSFDVEAVYDGIYYGKGHTPLSNSHLLVVKKDGKYAVFSKAGNKVVSGFDYDGYEFTEGRGTGGFYLMLKKGNKKFLWNDIAKNAGEPYDDIVIEPRTFTNGISSVEGYDFVKFKKGDTWGVPDYGRSNTIVPFEYDGLLMETRYQYTTLKKGLKGLYTGYINIPPAYRAIDAFKELHLSKRPPYMLFKV
ncbi:MAG: hypothetical protein V4581_17605, partial [Bacteroidota bacterium]